MSGARHSDPAAADAHARIFREAQRSADTIFSHYQLSQLLATHALPATMAQAVLDELVHVCEAAAGLLWLTPAPGSDPELVARAGEATEAVEPLHVGAGPVRVDLEDVGTVVLVPPTGTTLDPAALRFLDLVRHELAIAFRGALLREALDRERAELAAVFQGASDAIVLVDADRRVTRLNPAAERMLRRGASSVVGEACHRALGCEAAGTPPRPCGGRCPFERVLRGGEPIDGDERLVASHGGEATSVVGSYAVTSRAPDGRRQAVAILRDTSELARLAELRRGFLGSVSHELRTPIALIRGYVETLLHLDPDAATTRTYLARIDEASGRLGTMVAQLLDASALAVDELDLGFVPIDLAALLREAVHELAVRFPGVSLRLAVDPDLPRATGDRERLRQVLDNVLANAATYGDAAAGIDIEARTDRAWLVVRVVDRGMGIPPDERDLVFEQFHRGRNVRERNVPGTGLGLAISRRVIEAHGGSIAFDPDDRHGTTLEIRLPLASGIVPGAAPAPAAAGAAP